MRAIIVALTIGFAVLGLVGIFSVATPWLAWLDLIGGVVGVIASFAATRRPNIEGGVSSALGVGAGVLWLIGLLTRATPWLVWWTFAFAIAFILAAVVEFSSQREARARA